MKDILHIEWPWTLIWAEYSDDFIAQLKESLPPDHELQKHDLVPEAKWERRPIFIVDDDTTGETILMNFEKMKRWKKTKYKLPSITVFRDRREVAEMIKRDHMAECAKYNDDGTVK
jgi:hypothetical protein